MKKVFIMLLLAGLLSVPVFVLAQTDAARQDNLRQQIQTITLLIAQLQLQLRQIMDAQQSQDYTANQSALDATTTFVSKPAAESVSKPIISVVPIMPIEQTWTAPTVTVAPVATVRAACAPDWQCAEWGACSSSRQTRNCTDANNCNVPDGQPALMQTCAPSFPAANQLAVAGTSSNWSGYASAGTSFTAINGSWVVPPQTASAVGLAGDAAWIGIGGITSSDLIQIGVQTFNNNGQIKHEAFYETLPQTAQTVTMTINTGDSVSASLNEQLINTWYLSIRDNTNGQHFETTLSYNSTNSSAEWIEEMPSNSNSTFIPLDNFGVKQFSGGSVLKSGGSYTIDQLGARLITMTNGNNQPLVAVSSLASDGESFSVTRTAAAPTSFANWQQTSAGVPYRKGFDFHSF